MISGLSELSKKVSCISNFDSFLFVPNIMDTYSEMVEDVVIRFYKGVTRYTTSAFLRMKLGESLKKRHLSPHIYESAEEARSVLTRE